MGVAFLQRRRVRETSTNESVLRLNKDLSGGREPWEPSPPQHQRPSAMEAHVVAMAQPFPAASEQCIERPDQLSAERLSGNLVTLSRRYQAAFLR